MNDSSPSLPHTYPAQSVEELDELTYKRFRSETNQSQSLTDEEAQQIRHLVSQLWRVPKVGPGDIVAGAKIEEVVGKGAFGTVWKARDCESEERRAVKVFDADRLGDGLAVHLFRRGVRAMLYLRQQNDEERSQDGNSQHLSKFIVRICEVEPHMLAFSMDWVPNRDLSYGYLRGRSTDDKIRIFRHIASAIHYAHTRPSPIVHRDIKPQNIVMNGDTPILTDFDIADMAFAKTLSRRAVGGAFAYAAPEQLSGECGHLEMRSDIYSLGRLLHFFLLEQDPPLLIERSPPLDELNEYPEGLVKIIRRCTHRDLPMRYANVGELLHELKEYEKVEEVGAFGPNLVLAQRYWKQAEEHATTRSWDAAFRAASQAQGYVESVDQEISESWSFRVKWWRLCAGELALAPEVLFLWFRRLPFPAAFAVVFLVLSPLAIPAAAYIRSQAKQDKLENAIQELIALPSLKLPKAQLFLAYIKEDAWRLRTARRRLALLLSRNRGRKSCRQLSLVYLLAPKGPHVIEYTGDDRKRHKIRNVDISKVLGLIREPTWGPIRCQPNRHFAWMTITPKSGRWLPGQFGFELHAPRSDLQFLHAERGALYKCNFSHSNLRQARLNGSNLMSAKLSGADLSYARMRGAKLNLATAVGAKFRFADLREVQLERANVSFADFRKARLGGAVFKFGTFQGTLFDANALPALRQGKLYHLSFRHAVCLSGGHFFLKGLVDQCHAWHQLDARQQGSTPQPPHCPRKLGIHAVFIAYPPGQLKREGQCPWHDVPASANAATRPHTRISSPLSSPLSSQASSHPGPSSRRVTPRP